jgi:antitoxin Phd
MATSTWQLQEAKARLSDLIKQAQQSGPQRITVRGENTAIVLSQQDYEKLIGEKKNLWDFLRASPLKGIELEIERDPSFPREIEL